MEQAWPMIMRTLPHILALCKWCEKYVYSTIQRGAAIEVDSIRLLEGKTIAESVEEIVKDLGDEAIAGLIHIV